MIFGGGGWANMDALWNVINNVTSSLTLFTYDSWKKFIDNARYTKFPADEIKMKEVYVGGSHVSNIPIYGVTNLSDREKDMRYIKDRLDQINEKSGKFKFHIDDKMVVIPPNAKIINLYTEAQPDLLGI